MPIYEYECSSCEILIEVNWSLAEYDENKDKPLPCEGCQKEMKRIVSQSSFQLKGSGWSNDGYTSARERGSAAGDQVSKLR